ncbi:MAG: hypothetical protein AB1465_07010, partial [Patescibacteria group bacterium]
GENDTMGLEWVSKQATKSSCGLWIPLHKDATTPSQKTWRISGFLLLRTVTCTGKAGDPC